MLQISGQETYQDGQIIFEEGSYGDWIYVVESGAVELSKNVLGEKIIIDVLHAEEIFGEIAFIADTPRTATACAVGETTLGIVDRNILDQEFNGLSQGFQLILKELVLRLKKTTETASHVKLRRKEHRQPKVLSLTYHSSEWFIKAYSENVSSNGIFVKTPKPLEVGEHFFLKLNLKSSPEPIEISCKVSWRRTETDDSERHPKGMGIKFVRISEDDQKKLTAEIKPDTNI